MAVGPSEGDSRFRESIDLGRVYIRMSEMAELGGLKSSAIINNTFLFPRGLLSSRCCLNA